jgi:membrane protease YdiL (CAAX protease family)
MSTLVVNPKPTLSGTIRNLLVSHPLVSFFVIAFAGSWLCFAPVVLGQDGLGLLPYNVPLWLYVVLFLSASFSGPTLGAFAVTAALEGKAGVKRFLHRYGQWRVGWHWYLVFLVGFPALYLVPATFWMGLAPWQALVQQWSTVFTVYLPALLIFPALINWGEEAGWRGFAQTRMQTRYGALWASLVVAFLHGIWHLPVFLLITGPVALGPFNLGTFLLNTLMVMVFTVIWTWIFNGAKQSILIASLTHATFNATQAWMGTLMPNQPEQVDMAVTFLIIAGALLTAILTKGRLGYTPAPANE